MISFREIGRAAMVGRYSSIFFIAVAMCLPSRADTTRFQFDGEISRTNPFTHELPEGLYLHLIPISSLNEGWKIIINKESLPIDPSFNREADNFADITPPLHGPNATAIDGGSIKDGKSGAFITDHQFEFALSRDDDKAVWAEYACALHASQQQNIRGEEGACKNLPRFPKRLGYATLHITEHPLSGRFKAGHSPDQTLNIDHMRFTVIGDYETPRNK